ncbi:hypothetical protein Gasu2_48140 [Galdieria sulphuraria]|uniref:Uncharacterized protein n=1 Tax=Galdieria sulphuraria TaxID=130081 RepID=M2XU14_GALSU|nr:uncharacterized protein Gasu_54720 [Galdieria sulphuraria]EME26899.1 hypothetical protein Gasu_54720 [Galdieria sulphuraria]GJD10634.1 hypothetical protein Gasu2_48140 [Galdieria sulphuraria]|eukprot:XP_005703419.1 hypothetical protein Gasu_54720 [Galdieria sulphuraria]
MWRLVRVGLQVVEQLKIPKSSYFRRGLSEKFFSLTRDTNNSRKLVPLITEVSDPRLFPSIRRSSASFWEDIKQRIEKYSTRVEFYRDLFASPRAKLALKKFGYFIAGFNGMFIYMSLEYGNWDFAYDLNATYADIDHVVDLIWDPTLVEYYMALRKTLNEMENGLDWLLFATYFEKTGDTNIAYEAKAMAYLVEGGKLEEFGNLVVKSPVPQRPQ